MTQSRPASGLTSTKPTIACRPARVSMLNRNESAQTPGSVSSRLEAASGHAQAATGHHVPHKDGWYVLTSGLGAGTGTTAGRVTGTPEPSGCGTVGSAKPT